MNNCCLLFSFLKRICRVHLANLAREVNQQNNEHHCQSCNRFFRQEQEFLVHLVRFILFLHLIRKYIFVGNLWHIIFETNLCTSGAQGQSVLITMIIFQNNNFTIVVNKQLIRIKEKCSIRLNGW